MRFVDLWHCRPGRNIGDGGLPLKMSQELWLPIRGRWGRDNCPAQGAPRHTARTTMGLRTPSDGDAETPVHFETGPKCLKFGHPDLRGPIRDVSDLRLYGVPYRPHGRRRPKFQTHAPYLEVNCPFAVPVVPGPAKRDWQPRPRRAKRTPLRAVSRHCTHQRAFGWPHARETHVFAYSQPALHAGACVWAAVRARNARFCV